MYLQKLANKAIDYSFYLLFFLVPLIMTPWNFELFEYNKMMLTYFLTIIIAGAWAIKIILNGRIMFKRTPFDIPLVLFLASQVASTIFSIDQHTSVWGYYSRFHGGLLSTISYLTLYWALVSNFDKAKTLSAIRYLLAAAAIVSVYGILEHLGIDAKYWVQDVQNRVFSTLGQPNWLAAYLAALIPIPICLAIQNRKNKSFFLFLSLSVFLFLCLIFTKSRSGIPAALISLVIFGLLLALPKILSLKKIYLYSFGIFLVLILATGSFWASKKYTGQLNDLRYIFGQTKTIQVTVHQMADLGSSSSDIRKIVWHGAVDIFKAYPVFGSGVETFAYSYYNFRPPEHNLLSEWDFLYNKAHNEYFNFLATTGAFGLGSYLLLIGWIMWQSLGWVVSYGKPTTQNSLLIPALFAGWFSILITNFFGFSVVPIAIFFFLVPACMIVILSKEEPQLPLIKSGKFQSWQNIAIILILLSSLFFLLSTFRFWQADVAFAQGTRLNRQGEYWLAYNSVQKAIDINSGEPVYQDELAWSAANLAVVALVQKDQIVSQQMTNLAINSSNKALAISPKNLNFYRTRAKVDFRLAQIDPKYLDEALKTLEIANQLAPTDAKIAYNLALVQEGLGKKDNALQTLEKTVAMKSNYVDAHYMLALLYKEEGQNQKAIDQLEYIVKFLHHGHPDATKKLLEWKGQ